MRFGSAPPPQAAWCVEAVPLCPVPRAAWYVDAVRLCSASPTSPRRRSAAGSHWPWAWNPRWAAETRLPDAGGRRGSARRPRSGAGAAPSEPHIHHPEPGMVIPVARLPPPNGRQVFAAGSRSRARTLVPAVSRLLSHRLHHRDGMWQRWGNYRRAGQGRAPQESNSTRNM